MKKFYQTAKIHISCWCTIEILANGSHCLHNLVSETKSIFGSRRKIISTCLQLACDESNCLDDVSSLLYHVKSEKQKRKM